MSSQYTAQWRKENPDKVKEIRKRYYEKNREVLIAKQKKWRQANPSKTKPDPERRKHTFYKSRYNISLEEYKKLLYNQQGVCAICLLPETTKANSGQLAALCVDHCHTTGVVRGLLCRNCNSALGKFKDSFDILEKAKQYLINGKVRQHSESEVPLA